MSRLYGIKYDSERWKVDLVDDTDYKTYKIVDKENLEIYYFNNIIGFEQVSADEFLVYRSGRANRDWFEIKRLILANSELDEIYSAKFSQFEFISDDKIMFTYWGKYGPYKISGIYSISQNKELEEGKWLETFGVNIDENGIVVEDRIYDSELGDNKLIFSIDPETLEPNSECYSSFRNSYVKIETKEDYEKLKEEEKKYINYVSNYYSSQKYQNINNARKRVLSKKN